MKHVPNTSFLKIQAAGSSKFRNMRKIFCGFKAQKATV